MQLQSSTRTIWRRSALIEGDNAETVEDFERANRAFHHTLVAPCAMPRLLASLDGLQLANSRLLFATARSSGWRPRSNQDHHLILQALRARNVDRACNLLARHIQTIERLTLPFPHLDPRGTCAPIASTL